MRETNPRPCVQVDRCREQQEQGLPPCPEIEEEWRRMLRDKRRRQRDKEERERVNTHTHRGRGTVMKMPRAKVTQAQQRIKEARLGHEAGIYQNKRGCRAPACTKSQTERREKPVSDTRGTRIASSTRPGSCWCGIQGHYFCSHSTLSCRLFKFYMHEKISL